MAKFLIVIGSRAYLSRNWCAITWVSTNRCPISTLWRHGGLMISALDSGSSGLGLSPGRGICVV